MQATFERPWVDLVEGDAPTRDLGLAVPFVAGPRERKAHQQLDEPEPGGAGELCERGGAVDAGHGKKAIGEAAGKRRAQCRDDGLCRRGQPLRPGGCVERRPLDAQTGRLAAREAAAHGDVRHVEHRGPAVAAMGEQESAARGAVRTRHRRGQHDVERDAGEVGVLGRIERDRRERRVGVMHGVAELGETAQSEAVRSGRRHRQPTGRDDHRVRRELPAIHRGELPAPCNGLEADDLSRPDPLDAPLARQRDERIAHHARAIGDREQLTGFRLEHQWQSHRLLEELTLLAQWPAAEDLAHDVGRRCGDEPGLVERPGQDVAPAAAGDEDLAPAVAGSFQQQRPGARGRRREWRP